MHHTHDIHQIRDFKEEFSNNSTESEIGMLDHDILFWLGDLNYRIDQSISVEEVRISIDQPTQPTKGVLDPYIRMIC